MTVRWLAFTSSLAVDYRKKSETVIQFGGIDPVDLPLGCVCHCSLPYMEDIVRFVATKSRYLRETSVKPLLPVHKPTLYNVQ